MLGPVRLSREILLPLQQEVSPLNTKRLNNKLKPKLSIAKEDVSFLELHLATEADKSTGITHAPTQSLWKKWIARKAEQTEASGP